MCAWVARGRCLPCSQNVPERHPKVCAGHCQTRGPYIRMEGTGYKVEGPVPLKR